jgi:hypothetical protein
MVLVGLGTGMAFNPLYVSAMSDTDTGESELVSRAHPAPHRLLPNARPHVELPRTRR